MRVKGVLAHYSSRARKKGDPKYLLLTPGKARTTLNIAKSLQYKFKTYVRLHPQKHRKRRTCACPNCQCVRSILVAKRKEKEHKTWFKDSDKLTYQDRRWLELSKHPITAILPIRRNYG